MDKKAEILLSRVKVALAEYTRLIQDRRKRLNKADSRSTAEALEQEIETLGARLDVLKVQQKALKRGIIPDDFSDGEAD